MIRLDAAQRILEELVLRNFRLQLVAVLLNNVLVFEDLAQLELHVFFHRNVFICQQLKSGRRYFYWAIILYLLLFKFLFDLFFLLVELVEVGGAEWVKGELPSSTTFKQFLLLLIFVAQRNRLF